MQGSASNREKIVKPDRKLSQAQLAAIERRKHERKRHLDKRVRRLAVDCFFRPKGWNDLSKGED